MRASALTIMIMGIGLLGTSHASASPISALPVRDSVSANSPAIEADYYYRGRRYPYYYHGHYYNYRYHGHYYNYRYHGRYYRYYHSGRYYNNRNCGWLPSHHYRCNYW